MMTVWETHVAPEKWAELERSYKSVIQDLPSQVFQTYLVHGKTDSSLWRIVTVWRSHEAFEEMRQSGTPAGLLMFRAGGPDISLTILDVVAQKSG